MIKTAILLLLLLLFTHPYQVLATPGEHCCPPIGMNPVPGIFNPETGLCEHSSAGTTIITNSSCNPATETCDATMHCAELSTTTPSPPDPGNGPCNDLGEACCQREVLPGEDYPEYYCGRPYQASSQNSSCVCGEAAISTPASISSPPIPTWDQCGLVPEDERETCKNCIKEGEGVYTALGCIQGDTGAFTTQLLVLAISIGGGIALLIMAVGVFIMATAAGNPEKMAGGQQTVMAAITGLLIIVFSVVILNLIGVEILNIPGF